MTQTLQEEEKKEVMMCVGEVKLSEASHCQTNRKELNRICSTRNNENMPTTTKDVNSHTDAEDG